MAFLLSEYCRLTRARGSRVIINDNFPYITLVIHSYLSIIERNMKNIVIINGISISPYARKSIKGEKNTINLVYDYARMLPDVEKMVILSSQAIEGDMDVITRGEWNTKELLVTEEG